LLIDEDARDYFIVFADIPQVTTSTFSTSIHLRFLSTLHPYRSTMAVDEVSKDLVTIAPHVLVIMTAHAISHPTTPVHGVFIGSRRGNKLEITDAYPICHETPTKVLVETSLSLVHSALEDSSRTTSPSSSIIGWYTAPELLKRTSATAIKPSPVELRIVASLETEQLQPVLLVLNNEAMVELSGEVAPETATTTIIKAFGKDFGNQWMGPLKCSVMDPSKALKMITGNAIEVKDLVDHWEAGASSDWTTSASISKLL